MVEALEAAASAYKFMNPSRSVVTSDRPPRIAHLDAALRAIAQATTTVYVVEVGGCMYGDHQILAVCASETAADEFAREYARSHPADTPVAFAFPLLGVPT